MSGFRDDYRRIAFVVLGVAFTFGAAMLFWPFLDAILWATTLSILTYPWYVRMRRRVVGLPGMNEDRAETLASIGTTLLTVVVIMIPFLLIGAALFAQFSKISQDAGGSSLDAVVAQVDQAIRPLAQQFGQPHFSVGQYVQEHRQDLVNSLRQPVASFAKQSSSLLATMLVALLTQYFFLKDGHRMRPGVNELSGLPVEKVGEILGRVSETVRAVFVGTVLVALVQGSVIGLAYAWAGVPGPVLLAVVSAIMCIIPLLGAPAVYVPVGLWLIAQGNLKGAAIVLLIGFIVVSNIDNVLKPFFIGGRTNLNPMGIFFSILGGAMIFGAIGVMAGPMILTVFLSLVEILRERLGGPVATVPQAEPRPAAITKTPRRGSGRARR